MANIYDDFDERFTEIFEDEETLDSLDFDENIIYEDYDDE